MNRTLPTGPVDVAVFGSGAGGLSAALTSALEGLNVALFEKEEVLGGTTSISGGAVWIAGTRQAKEAGAEDSKDKVRLFLRNELGNNYRDDLIEAYLDSGPEALEYLEGKSEVAFSLGNVPDYHTETEGASELGRCLVPKAFDGRKLGKSFSLLRTPPAHFLVLGGMMIGRREIPAFLAPFSSRANFAYVTRSLLRYARDRMTHARGTNLLMGNALVARFMASLDKLKVPMVTEARLTGLLVEGDRVIGAKYEQRGEEHEVRARHGVVVATGGFPAGAAMRETLSAAFAHAHTAAPGCNQGDGIAAALDAGGAVHEDVFTTAFWTPVTLSECPGEQAIVMPYGHLDRGKPGAIIVGRDGRRFVNEAASYHDVTLAMFDRLRADPEDRFYILCDRRFIREYGLGLVRPRSRTLGKWIRNGYLYTGSTLEALAGRLQLPAPKIVASIERHNSFCADGRDPDLGKGETEFNRYNGDPACLPNPCLRPISEAPFYAVRIRPGTIGTAIGLDTDADARVLNSKGFPIAGLYACGNDMGSIMRGHYPGPGITIGPAITFGWRAARRMGREAQAQFDASVAAR